MMKGPIFVLFTPSLHLGTLLELLFQARWRAFLSRGRSRGLVRIKRPCHTSTPIILLGRVSDMCCSDRGDIKAERVCSLSRLVCSPCYFPVEYGGIALANVMALMMIMITLAIWVGQLVSFCNIIKQFLAVLLHFQRNIDINRDKSPTRATLRCE
jgi:hypothetical protein